MTDRPRYTAPMPPGLRHQMRAGQHPSRSVPCPHCGAKAHAPCVLRKTGRRLPQPHPQRLTNWARTTAHCPECQAEPDTNCHTPDGNNMPDHELHDRRYTEAEETLA